MKSFQKHHFAPWSEARPEGGFAKLLVAPGEGHTHCLRCDVFVVMKRVGGLKFWVGGKLVSKRPVCVVPEENPLP